MVTGIWGRKIGMTQVFSDNGLQCKVTPVTVVDVNHWFVVAKRLQLRDGYDAVQIGWLRKKHHNSAFDAIWLKNLKRYFQMVREVKSTAAMVQNMQIGQPVDFYNDFTTGQPVSVIGWSKGKGFAGTYKRHGFGGAAKSHGSTMGRRPGSIGALRTSGRVIKGKRMAGHLGTDRVLVQGLDVVSIDPQARTITIKGSVPGSAGSFVFIRKA